MAAIEYRGINAVTNFELSSYITWLKPHSQSHSHHYNSSIFQHNIPLPDTATYLFQATAAATTTADTSRTALGLLLKSSVFRDLLQKNVLNIDGDQAEDQISMSPFHYTPLLTEGCL